MKTYVMVCLTLLMSCCSRRVSGCPHLQRIVPSSSTTTEKSYSGERIEEKEMNINRLYSTSHTMRSNRLDELEVSTSSRFLTALLGGKEENEISTMRGDTDNLATNTEGKEFKENKTEDWHPRFDDGHSHFDGSCECDHKSKPEIESRIGFVQPWKTTRKPKRSKAQQWCFRYETDCNSLANKTEGIKPRIIGGRAAKPREHLYMVLIGYGSERDKQWLCGGSLISPLFVLSAAHCSSAGKWGLARFARMGDLDISTGEDDSKPQEKFIVERLNHPNYKEPPVYNDIALFKLDSLIEFNAWVRPLCLHTENRITEPKAIILGWGRTTFVAETSSILMEAEVGFFNSTDCTSLMEGIGGNRMPRGVDPELMVCAGEREGGKDACSGDSGGPLVIETDKCTKTQVGITSIGRECGLPNSPGIYTRVSRYIEWIESIVWP